MTSGTTESGIYVESSKVYTGEVRKFALWVFDEPVFRMAQEAAQAAGLPLSRWVTAVIREACQAEPARRRPVVPAVERIAAPVDARVQAGTPMPIPPSPRCRCGHTMALHLYKGVESRCQHPTCYPTGCPGYREAV